MLRDVLMALKGTGGLAGAAVVTLDDSAREIAREAGASLIDDTGQGLNAALTLGCRVLQSYGAKAVMIVHSDLPLADPLECQAVIDAAKSPGITIVPAREDGGTNVMVISPPDAIPLDYGKDSFAKHKQAAESAGVPVIVVELPGLGLDIDRPDDVKALIRAGAHGATADYLLASGLAEQLQTPQLTGSEDDPQQANPDES